MTATHVDGIAVIADEATKSPINDRAGKPIYWQQIRTLLLEDDTTTYGCLHCDYTADKPASIRPHLNKHKDKVMRKAVKRMPASEMSLSELLAKLAELEKVTAERDEWKRRALTAERKLATMRKALSP